MALALWFSFTGLAAILLAATGAFAVLYTDRTSDLNQRLTTRLTGTAVAWPPPFFKVLGIGILVFGAIYASLSWLIVFFTAMAERANLGSW